MSKDTPRTSEIKAHSPSSALDRLTLTFEYNVSYADEKKSIKERTS